jgi:hypothetical protein
VAAGRENPLVTEWPAAEKANLEGLSRSGAVAVEYSGCSMRILPACRPGGAYRWQRTTVTSDMVDIQNEDDLYAKLPLGAVSLEGELARSGRIAVQTTVSGQLRLENLSVADVPERGECGEATHIIGALSIGSFKMRSGGAVRATGGVGVGTLGGGASTQSQEVLLRAAGDPASCTLSTDEVPHHDCASPIQLFLLPLPRHERNQPRAGMVKTTFVSASGGISWDVRTNTKVICKTPCTQYVDPVQSYQLKASKVFFMEPETTLDVPDLRPYANEPALEVRATPPSDGMFQTGVILSFVGTLTALLGGFLMLADCGESDGAGTCTAGAITTGVSAAMIGVGVWLIVGSAGETEVTPSNRGSLPLPLVF